MNLKKSVIIAIAVAAGILFGIIYAITSCDDSTINVESENLVADSTCYVGNYNCPKYYVKVRNKSNSTYLVWVEVNFYYNDEFACSEQSTNVTLLGGDTYTFEIQSSMGTKFFIDKANWSCKITKIGTIEK